MQQPRHYRRRHARGWRTFLNPLRWNLELCFIYQFHFCISLSSIVTSLVTHTYANAHPDVNSKSNIWSFQIIVRTMTLECRFFGTATSVPVPISPETSLPTFFIKILSKLWYSCKMVDMFYLKKNYGNSITQESFLLY